LFLLSVQEQLILGDAPVKSQTGFLFIL